MKNVKVENPEGQANPRSLLREKVAALLTPLRTQSRRGPPWLSVTMAFDYRLGSRPLGYAERDRWWMSWWGTQKQSELKIKT